MQFLTAKLLFKILGVDLQWLLSILVYSMICSELQLLMNDTQNIVCVRVALSVYFTC